MSFQQGISGLTAASRNLEVIGNNIANANTVGAKSARAEFADIYATTVLRPASPAAGMGVTVQGVTQQFTQGSIKVTENANDIAINGSGFFVVKQPGSMDSAYSRNGQFQLDAQSYMVTGSGMRLQGFTVDPTTGRSTSVLGDIQLPQAGVAPKVTANAKLGLNLDSRTAAPAANADPFKLGDAGTFTSSTAMTVYDQQGNEHTLGTYYRRTANANEWEVYTALDGKATPAFTTGSQLPVGRLTFGADGALDATKSGTLDASGTLTPGSALTLQLPFPSATLSGSTTAPVQLSYAGTTQFGTAFAVNDVSQDGNRPGSLTGFTVDAAGTVQARYSNGMTLATARIALANFQNPQGLVPGGNNIWRATSAAGSPAVGEPGTGNLGALQGGALEESNIDLTAQLVDMITAQRAYQANAQTLKTQDQMMTTLVNLR